MMTLYLVQHAEAKSKEEDPDRPLTERGRVAAANVARALARAGVQLHNVYHSGKLRAEQTAGLFAAELDPVHSPSPMDGLRAMDEPAVAAEAVAKLDAPTMLIGHLPHMNRLASLLIAGDADADAVAFHNAGVVCLHQRDDGGWRLDWAVPPRFLA